MRRFLYYTICLMGIVAGCDCSGQKNHQKKDTRTVQERMEDREQATRDFLAKERESIDSYIKERNLNMQRTGTGLYYQVLEDNSTDSIKSGDDVTYNYDIYMLNGELLYTSKEKGVGHLLIDREDAVIGLHEALKNLGTGDKGRFILPSHLAYGVAGDQIKVPPMTALVYEIEILEIK